MTRLFDFRNPPATAGGTDRKRTRASVFHYIPIPIPPVAELFPDPDYCGPKGNYPELVLRRKFLAALDQLDTGSIKLHLFHTCANYSLEKIDLTLTAVTNDVTPGAGDYRKFVNETPHYSPYGLVVRLSERLVELCLRGRDRCVRLCYCYLGDARGH